MARFEGQLPLLDRVGLIHDQGDGFALGGAAHPLLGHQDGLLGNTFLDHGPDKHARQEQIVGIGHHDAQGERAGGRIHGDVPELQGAFQGIGSAVFQENADFSAVDATAAELAAFQLAF